MGDFASEGRTKAIKRRLGTAEPPKPKVELPPLPIRISDSGVLTKITAEDLKMAWYGGRYACRCGCDLDFPTDGQRIGHELRVHKRAVETSKVLQAGEVWTVDMQVTFK